MVRGYCQRCLALAVVGVLGIPIYQDFFLKGFLFFFLMIRPLTLLAFPVLPGPPLVCWLVLRVCVTYNPQWRFANNEDDSHGSRDVGKCMFL